MTTSTPPNIEFKGISRVFPAVKALNNVSFSIPYGSVRAILGEAGSGKSTLLRIFGGLLRPTHGKILINGRHVRFRSPVDAIKSGIAVIPQDCHIFPSMTVAENLFLGHYPGNSWFIQRNEHEKHAVEFLKRGHLDISPSTHADQLTLGQQKLLQICRALVLDAPILAFDEPAHSLSAGEVEILFDVMNELKAQGRTIILVTRRVEEVFRICDAATVLRDGELIETFETLENVTSEELLSRMLGKDIAEMYKSRLQRIMRGVIHNVGNSATVSNLAQQQTHEQLEQECMPLVDFIKSELIPSLKEASTVEDSEVIERVEALENVLNHLDAGLRAAINSMHTVDDRLKHIGSIVEIQQHYVDELGTEDVITLKRIVDEAVAMAKSDRLKVQWSAPKDSAVLVDRSMLTQLCASFIAELLRVTETDLEFSVTANNSNLVLQLQSAEPVQQEECVDLASIISDARLFFERYNGVILAQYTPNALLRVELPKA